MIWIPPAVVGWRVVVVGCWLVVGEFQLAVVAVAGFVVAEFLVAGFRIAAVVVVVAVARFLTAPPKAAPIQFQFAARVPPPKAAAGFLFPQE